MTPPDRPTITPELVAKFRAYYLAHGQDWGSLHVVLEDHNIHTDHVAWTVQWAEEHGDQAGAELARILLTMSKSQRGRVGRWAELPQLTTLDCFWVEGRGYAHVVDVPPYVNDYRDPRTLVGRQVWIDGQRRVVGAVEAPAVPWTPGSPAHRRVSVIVSNIRGR